MVDFLVIYKQIMHQENRQIKDEFMWPWWDHVPLLSLGQQYNYVSI